MGEMRVVMVHGSIAWTTFLLAGCMVTTEAGDDFYSESDDYSVDAVESEQLGEADGAFTYSRSDYQYTVTPSEGHWGDWRQNIYCAPGMWAIGYKLRVEGGQGRGDDTALNSVQLLCQSATGSTSEWISSYDGWWGSWGSATACSGAANFLTSARMRIEDGQGRGDDTAANDVEFGCRLGGSIHTTNGSGWGVWKDWGYCPVGTAVCGISIRFEGSQGRGDDTAMNGMRLHCCSL
ncbi:hypothetical protein [Sorangium sp. So ce385]|uniref:hypothetical protein n=2 Tax=unclassified Sorangium TaxID=2621164 RepID=UPI003F5C1481